MLTRSAARRALPAWRRRQLAAAPLPWTQLQRVLFRIHACAAGRYRVWDQTIDQAWDSATEAEDLRWLLGRIYDCACRRGEASALHVIFSDPMAERLFCLSDLVTIREVFRGEVAAWARRVGLPVRSRARRWRVEPA